MDFEIDKYREILNFDEKKLIETYYSLEDARKNGRGVFSKINYACDNILPKGMVRGSREHGNYAIITTIMDVATNSEKLHEECREAYELNSKIFDPKFIYELDKDKLRIGRKGRKSEQTTKRLIDRDTGKTLKEIDMRHRVFIAPETMGILKENFPNIFHDTLSGSIFSTCRKIYKVYDNDIRKLFDGVTDPDVAYRRLDMDRSQPPMYRRRNDTSKMIFGGIGRKTASLFVIKAVNAGIANGMDRTDMLQPFDRHLYNLCVSRGIIKLEEWGMRKERLTKMAQKLFRNTFHENSLDVPRFHENQWILGSNVCAYPGCYDRNTDGQKSCIFEDACDIIMDDAMYSAKGIVKPMKR